MKTSIKTVKLPLVTPKPEVQRELERVFREFRWIYDEAAKRLPSLPRRRIGRSKAKTYYEWVREFRRSVDLPAQVAQQAVGKARESYASMLSNNVYNEIPRSRSNVARFHNQCFHIERFGDVFFLDLPVRGGRRDNRVLLPFQKNGYSGAVLKDVVSTKLSYGASELKRYGSGYSFNLVVKSPVEVQEGITPVGVDFGLTNIAVACAYAEDGSHVKLWSGKQARHKRKLFLDRIKKLSKKGLLKEVRKTKDKYRRYMRTKNHQVSREIIEFASKYVKPVIVLENLHLFRKQNDWTFSELRRFIEYKALEQGSPVVAVDPKNTSNRCNRCGYTDPGNRDGIVFRCLGCGYQVNADVNAAVNLAQAGCLGVDM